jgi:hypothetical protein
MHLYRRPTSARRENSPRKIKSTSKKQRRYAELKPGPLCPCVLLLHEYDEGASHASLARRLQCAYLAGVVVWEKTRPELR